MNLDKAEEAYWSDPVFRQLVETLKGLIHQLQLTPSEIRCAAMFACILNERTNPATFVFLDRETIERLRRDLDPEVYKQFVLGEWDKVKAL